MLSVPSHRLWPPVSLPRCHRHFSSSSTCFAHAWMVLRSDITWAGPLACLLVCLLALRQPLVQSCIPCAQRNLEPIPPVKPARLCKHPWHSVCSSQHSPKQNRAHQCTRPTTASSRPGSLDSNPARWIAAARRRKLQSPSVKRVDAAIATLPCSPWPPRHTSSSPPSPCYTSFAPSVPIYPSSNSEATGRQDGRGYGCSRRRAAVRCTSVSQHSIASMVSTPRDMAFSRYQTAGKSRASAPTHHQKKTTRLPRQARPALSFALVTRDGSSIPVHQQ